MHTRHFAFMQDSQGLARELRSDVIVAIATIFDSRQILERPNVKIQGIWDTGATNSVITQNVVEALGLKPTGMATIGTAGGNVDCPTYIIDVVLPNGIAIQNLRVTGNDSLTSCDMLIGMDVIGFGDFAIANAKGNTHFSFCIPAHNKPICLVEKSEKVDKKFKSASAFTQ